MNYKTKIMVMIATAMVIPVLLVSSYLLNANKQMVETYYYNNLRHQFDIEAKEIERRLEENIERVKRVADELNRYENELQEIDGGKEKLNKFLQHISYIVGEDHELYIINELGIVELAENPELVGKTLVIGDYVEDKDQDQGVMVGIWDDANAVNQSQVTFISPLNRSNYYVVMGSKGNDFNVLNEQLNIYPTAKAFVVLGKDGNGEILSIDENGNISSSKDSLQDVLFIQHNSDLNLLLDEKPQKVGYYKDLNSIEGFIVCTIDSQEIYGQWCKLIYGQTFFLGLVIVVALCLGGVVVRYMNRQMNIFSRVFTKIQQGERETRIGYDRNSEMNRLVEGFNNMLDELDGYTKELSRDKNLFHSANAATSDLLLVIRLGEKSVEVDCKKWSSLFGTEPPVNIQNMVKQVLKRIHPNDLGVVNELLEKVRLEECTERLWCECRFLNTKNEYIWLRGDVVAVYDDGYRFAVVASISNINDAKEKEIRAIKAAQLDSLTGLYNKKAIIEKIEMHLVEANHYGALYMIDVDGFKGVNDNIGHQFGDQILMELARILEEIFTEQGLVARMGGDEFAVFYLTSVEMDIDEKASEIIRRFNLSESSHLYRTTCSIGIAEIVPGISYDELFARADFAMYHIKKMGKNYYYRYNRFLDERRARDEYILACLDKDIVMNKEEVNFELIREILGNEIVGFEFSLEGTDKNLVNVNPNTVLEVAIKYNRINKLSQKILILYLDTVRIWQQEINKKFNISVSLYYDKISYKQIIILIEQYLARESIDVSCCTLEFNIEYIQYLDKIEVLKTFINQLTTLGFRVGVYGIDRHNINFKLMVDYQIDNISFSRKFIQEAVSNIKYREVIDDLATFSIKNRIRVKVCCNEKELEELNSLGTIPYLYNNKERFSLEQAIELVNGAGERELNFYDSLVELDVQQKLDGKMAEANFSRNYFFEVAKYVFEVLYSNVDMGESIHQILGLVGRSFKLGRICIYEVNGEETHNTFQWYAEHLEHTDIQEKDELFRKLNQDIHYGEHNMFFMDHEKHLTEQQQTIIKQFGIHTMLSYRVVANDKIIGYIIFSQCDAERKWTDEEVDMLLLIAKITGNFFIRNYDEQQVLQSYESLYNMMNYVDAYVFAIDIETREIRYYNNKVREINPRVDLGIKCYQLMEGEKQTEPCNHCCIERLQESGQEKQIIYNRHLDCWYDSLYSLYQGEDGRTEVMCSLFDVSDRVNYEKKLEKVAYIDTHLDIYNRDAYYKRMHSCFVQEKCRGIAVGLELYCYRHFNEVFGHKYSKMFLRKVIDIISEVGLKEYMYRIDNDQLVFLIENGTLKDGEFLLDFLRKRFKKPISIMDIRYLVTFRLAVVEYPKVAKDSDEIISCLIQANRLMEKSNGIDYVVFDDHLASKVKRRQYIEELVNRGIEERRFEVHYQPIVGEEEQGIRAEALLRLRGTDGVFISPAEFIPIAEEMGRINHLGSYVLREVCKTVRELLDLGKRLDFIDVNVSPIQFMQENYVQGVEQILKQYGVPARCIQLEITESIFINSVERVSGILNELNDKGISIALDDFGTGYSSLNYLLELPINTMKIDKSLIDHIEQSVDRRLLLKNIFNLAVDYNLQVIVEGVEDKNQVDILRNMGFNQYQGYYFSVPLSKERFMYYEEEMPL